jgi:hypothetical protein
MKPLKPRRCIAVHDKTGRRCGNLTRARHSNLCREHRGSLVLALMDLFNPKPFRRKR